MNVIQSHPQIAAAAAWIAKASFEQIFVAIPAAEMTARAVVNVFRRNEDDKQDISANLGGAIFYGLCAANIVPGTAAAGSLIFMLYAEYCRNWNQNDDRQYHSVKILNAVVHDIPGKIVDAVWPIVEKIGNAVWPIFEAVGNLFKKIGELVTGMFVNAHPVWLGVGAIVSMIAAKALVFGL